MGQQNGDTHAGHCGTVETVAVDACVTVQPGRVTTPEEIPGKPDMSSLHYFFNDQLSLSDYQIYVRDQDNTESDRLS